MGLLEPQHIILLFIFGFIFIGPIWGYRAGSKRTIGGGFGLILGLFLGVIGVAIVYCSNKVDQQPFAGFAVNSAADELQKYKQLLDSGAITEAEYNIQKAKILNR
jgi:Short C-terminal domain